MPRAPDANDVAVADSCIVPSTKKKEKKKRHKHKFVELRAAFSELCWTHLHGARSAPEAAPVKKPARSSNSILLCSFFVLHSVGIVLLWPSPPPRQRSAPDPTGASPRTEVADASLIGSGGVALPPPPSLAAKAAPPPSLLSLRPALLRQRRGGAPRPATLVGHRTF
ncbi:unnamed protein product [Prorocentrum cordatum]|uniref:Ribosome biogenesis protein NOP53 n=1 Tax=Prorocentrum cordatum TaxID=2364126 RepID=A0ABN9VH96_9DINO|nr:unnamed protein product [Polarella glacialis]